MCLLSATPAVLAIDWGPVAAWAGAAATLLAVIVTALVALRYFDYLRGPRLHVTFEATEPWCRQGEGKAGARGLWIRLGVENRGAGAARCVGRLISVTTDGTARADVDPVQLRWAGLPRSRAFNPIGLGRNQREFLNVLFLAGGARWRLVTFDDPDFDPGFATELPREGRHVIRISVFADNADTVTTSLVAANRPGVDEPDLALSDRTAPPTASPRP